MTAFSGVPSTEKQNVKEPPPQTADDTHIYLFDHGELKYLQSCGDSDPAAGQLAQNSEKCATLFWSKLFGIISCITHFLIAFVLELFRFILCSLVRPLIYGLLDRTADSLFKPLLSVTFNGFIQPTLTFGYNIASSLKSATEPIVDMFRVFTLEMARVITSLRLVEITNNHKCTCENKNNV